MATWMGRDYLTLADLWPTNPKALVVGINPTPRSVESGHYYQGPYGKRFFTRLRDAGVLPAEPSVADDDLACQMGLAFTDLVKRPTPGASDLTRQEMDYGQAQLEKKLELTNVPLVIFVFKKPATQLLGRFPGHGLIGGKKIGLASVFVMPGPTERKAIADKAVRDLRELWQTTRCGTRL